jgi:acetyltransferase
MMSTENGSEGGARSQPLGVFFRPQTVAVVGATETPGSVGRSLMWNLLTSPFGGTVFPINPKRSSVLGVQARPSLKAIGEPIDLAVIATPAATVPGIIAECVELGVGGAVVISAGFREAGSDGRALEQQIRDRLRGSPMRVIGPNCLGVMAPLTGLNATFAQAMARPGKVAFLSQSGALCTAVLDWSLREHVGFSAFLSLGSMLDVGWGDLIDYLGDDPHTHSILLYVESIGDAHAFLSAAREVAFTKPIIVIKAGRTEAAAHAAASHTGALTGSDEVLDAAFRRCGVLRVNRISDVFYMADVLAKQPRPTGPRLAILTNAGGPAVLAVDALLTNGGELASLSDETTQALNKLLPPHWSHANPIDILGDASPERYASALEIAVRDSGNDGLLVILTPQGVTDPTQVAEHLKAYAHQTNKPILASWMGADRVASGEAVLSQAGIPVFSYPDTAALVFSYMWRYSYNLRGLYECPALPSDASENPPDRAGVADILAMARREGRTILTEPESKALLAAYGIPTVPTRTASSEAEAVRLAEEIGYPVALKLYSRTITHKTDVGGVRLNLAAPDQVRQAYQAIEAAVRERAGAEHFQGVTVQPMIRAEGYELILGSSIDSQFGPILLFGTGGQLVEVFKDSALALPPLNAVLARRLMEQTKISKALRGVRGRPPVDLAALEQLLVRFSQLVVEQPRIKEIDINPLLASPARLLALDARVVLHGPDVVHADLPRPVVRPYPTQYVGHWALEDGTTVTIRPIRPEDEPLMVDFHKALSEESVYNRYFRVFKLSQRVTHERLSRICFIDYDRQMALVAEGRNGQTGAREILGIGRMVRVPGSADGDVGVIVADPFQHRGVGTELVRRLVAVAREEKVRRLTADVLPHNQGMIHVFEKLAFRRYQGPDPALVAFEYLL